MRIGSIIVEKEPRGNLTISKTHTPSERIVIERADIDDLERALSIVIHGCKQVKDNSFSRSWQRENLASAIYSAIIHREVVENAQGFTVDSSLLAGWKEMLKSIKEGQQINLVN